MIIYVDIDDTICYRTDKTNLDYATSLPHKERIEKINWFLNLKNLLTNFYIRINFSIMYHPSYFFSTETINFI